VLTGRGHEKRSVPAGVEVRGYVAPDELLRLYRTASALVFPSLYEGFGQPLLEAMASGCAVAAAATGAISVRAAAQSKVSKANAKYQDKPKGDQRCDGCVQFVAPDGCKVVDGKISPSGWCMLYAAKPK
jgi:hypothetical protein